MEKARELMEDVKKLKSNWDDRSQFKLKGVENLSVSDLEQLDLYVGAYIESGGTGFGQFTEPLGDIKEVLDAYGIKSKGYTLF